MNKTVLIADDDHNILASLSFLLEEEGFRVLEADSPFQAKKIIATQPVDLLISDMNFHKDTTSGLEGIDLVRSIHQSNSDIPIIVMTGWATIDIAVEALKSGARDFIQKPWNDDQLLASIRTQLKLADTEKQNQTLNIENRRLTAQSHPATKESIVAQSQSMQSLLGELEQLAASDMNILLTGDNGTGKSMLARFIHNASSRTDKNFVSVNMGAISENLFESEMFGHNKGAFTDAKEDRAGRFEVAEGGTLFLDELANIPLKQQAKLLRVLEERQFERVGGNRTFDANVRIISATNANLSEEISEGQFRQDLYYRLNTIEIRVPSLSERVEDIIPLCEFFLENYSKKYNKDCPSLSKEVKQQLIAYSWPGNIRELSHLMERLLFTCRGKEISFDILNKGSTFASSNLILESNHSAQEAKQFDDGVSTLDAIEKQVMESRLVQFEGNVTETAKSLGLSRSGYYRRIQKYDLDKS